MPYMHGRSVVHRRPPARAGAIPAIAALLVGAAVAVAPPADAAERTITYTVVTQGTVYGDVNQLSAVAGQTLNDVRGWSLGGSISYQQVAAAGNFRVVLASPSAVAAASSACSPDYSCRVGNSVYINDNNWRNATPSWTYGVAEYQRYVLMHEVGHWLGLGHTSCPAGGQAAAVMQQQSKGLVGCLANVWPLGVEREAVSGLRGVSLNRTPIEAKHLALGRSASAVGAPVVWERPLAAGSFQHFQRGSIYFSGATGAREVRGAIRDHWSALGWELGPLGYPGTDELGTPDGVGRYNHFAGSGGGSIYWTPRTGAHAVYGAIRKTWEALGWEPGPLGYPVTSELATPDGVGRYNHFAGSGGGSIYWTPLTGAHAVYGAIRKTWEALGWELGPLGYPINSEYDVPQGRASDFQGGTITWNRATGETTVVYR